jgi:curved DNA-binding protein CbpA
MSDYYELLGLSRDGDLSPEKIKKAFIVKAMLWHPDKAPTEKDKVLYTKLYEELQKAYKTLSNEDSRRAYADSKQRSNIELAREERDMIGYEKAAEYMLITERGLAFDRDAFIKDFENKRDAGDKKLIEKATPDTERITTNDYQKFLAERERSLEINNIFSGNTFNPDLFNKTFEYVKKNNPSQGLQEYIPEPSAMGLDEVDTHTGVNFESNIKLSSGSYAGLDVGVAFNPKSFDFSKIKDQELTQEKTISAAEAKKRVEALQMMRDENILTTIPLV